MENCRQTDGLLWLINATSSAKPEGNVNAKQADISGETGLLDKVNLRELKGWLVKFLRTSPLGAPSGRHEPEYARYAASSNAQLRQLLAQAGENVPVNIGPGL